MVTSLSAYLELTKPKVTLLNLLVGATCFVLAAFPVFDWVKLFLFIVAGYLACGGCCALNCVFDRDTDQLMQRTKKRAIPSGLVTPRAAAFFGILLTGLGVLISYIFFNALTAMMMVIGAIFYLGVYTVLLKRRSSCNVVIGGFAGCFAALSGWTAAANSLSMVPLLVSSVDFLWTPGHLWGLAIKKVHEYKKAGIPMLSVTAGFKRTSQAIFFFNVATFAVSLLISLLGLAGIVYSVFALSVGIWFTMKSRTLLAFPSETGGFRVFVASMPYLTILMAGLIIDKVLSIVL